MCPPLPGGVDTPLPHQFHSLLTTGEESEPQRGRTPATPHSSYECGVGREAGSTGFQNWAAPVLSRLPGPRQILIQHLTTEPQCLQMSFPVLSGPGRRKRTWHFVLGFGVRCKVPSSDDLENLSRSNYTFRRLCVFFSFFF